MCVHVMFVTRGTNENGKSNIAFAGGMKSRFIINVFQKHKDVCVTMCKKTGQPIKEDTGHIHMYTFINIQRL